MESDSLYLAGENIIDYSLLYGIGKLTIDQMKKYSLENRRINHKHHWCIDQILQKDGKKIFLGIIDTLTYFSAWKKAEFAYKRIV